MKTLISIVVILTISFSNSFGKKLESDRIVKEVFTETEIVELKKILIFFDTEICNLFNKANLYDCYEDYFAKHQENDSLGILDPMIPYENQLELFSSLDSSFISKIWELTVSYKVREDKYYEIYNLNSNRKYGEFLKLLASKNRKFVNYAKSLENAGAISPSMIGGLIMFYEKYNIKDEKVRLVFAIHYLTLNDEIHSSRLTTGFK
jgi:hypothetical protein